MKAAKRLFNTPSLIPGLVGTLAFVGQHVYQQGKGFWACWP